MLRFQVAQVTTISSCIFTVTKYSFESVSLSGLFWGYGSQVKTGAPLQAVLLLAVVRGLGFP